MNWLRASSAVARRIGFAAEAFAKAFPLIVIEYVDSPS